MWLSSDIWLRRICVIKPIEELCKKLKEFEGKTLVSVNKEGVDLSEDEEKKNKEGKNVWKPLQNHEEHLRGKSQKGGHVQPTADTQCCIVTSTYGWTTTTERIWKAQVLRDNSTMGYMAAKKHLAINPDHSTTETLGRNGGRRGRVCERSGRPTLWNFTPVSQLQTGRSQIHANRIYEMIKLDRSSDDDDPVAGGSNAAVTEKRRWHIVCAKETKLCLENDSVCALSSFPLIIYFQGFFPLFLLTCKKSVWHNNNYLRGR